MSQYRPEAPAPHHDADLLAKASGENFPVALTVLPRRYRERLQAVYRFARYVDDLGDEAPEPREPRLNEVADEVRRLYADEQVSDPVVAALAPLRADCAISDGPWLRLIEANLVDQRRHAYQTFDDLLSYCKLSADPVGEIVLHVFGKATPERLALSNRICTGLQLLEHWQDVGEDARRGRVYLPAEDLDRFDVSVDELALPVASERLRALLAFETDRATAWLDSGAGLLATLRGWAWLSVSGYLAGGRAAAAAIRRAGHDPLANNAKPSSKDMAAAWLKGLFGAVVRR